MFKYIRICGCGFMEQGVAAASGKEEPVAPPPRLGFIGILAINERGSDLHVKKGELGTILISRLKDHCNAVHTRNLSVL